MNQTPLSRLGGLFPGLLATCLAAQSGNNSNPNFLSWIPLPVGTSDASAVVDHLGRLYMLGGNNSPVYPYATSDCWRFDSVSNAFVAIAAMSVARSNFAVAVDYRGRIYAFGGFGNDPSNQIMGTCERYDPSAGATAVWSPLPNMPRPLGYNRAVATPEACRS